MELHCSLQDLQGMAINQKKEKCKNNSDICKNEFSSEPEVAGNCLHDRACISVGRLIGHGATVVVHHVWPVCIPYGVSGMVLRLRREASTLPQFAAEVTALIWIFCYALAQLTVKL